MTKEEAIERIKSRYDKWAIDDKDLEAIAFFIPKLAESDDERIRKVIVKHFEELHENSFINLEIPDILAWLEKQKENVEKEYVFRPLAGTDITIAAEQAIRRANEGDRLVLAFNGAYIPVRKGCNANKIVDIYDAFIEKQKEQPQEELVYRLNGLMQEYVKEGKDEAEKEHRFKCYQLFWDALEDANFFEQKEQKPAEWSEEDEKTIGDAYCWLSEYAGFIIGENKEKATMLFNLAKRLKSLRPSWKPSKEQIMALKNSAYGVYQNGDGPALRELYEQLNKLGVQEEPEYYQHFDPDC